MDDYFVFGGRSTREFGLHVEHFPAQDAPKRRRTEVNIPGRNGALHYDEGGFENVDLTYQVWFRGDVPSPEAAHRIKGWLLGEAGYRRLEDKYDPLHYRLASFAGPLSIDNILNRYGRAKIKFDCDPRAFLKSGEFAVEIASGGVIVNPTAFAASPTIYAYGEGAGSVSIGGVTVQINEMTTGMVLDCENMLAHAMGDVGQSLDGDILAPDFPILEPGENRVLFDGGVTSIKIVPRWWEI